MDAKTAVQKAFEYFVNIFENEEMTNIGLEEIIFDEAENAWEVTIGFSRPWDYTKPGLLTGEQRPIREYKTVKIDDQTGEVQSIRIREVQSA